MGKVNKNDHTIHVNDYLHDTGLTLLKAEGLSGKQHMTEVTTSIQLTKRLAALTSSSKLGRIPVTSRKSNHYDYFLPPAVYLFKQGRHGPELVTTRDDVVHSTDLNTSDLDSLGCYYSLALGQGNHYNEGLYGPLPVLGTGLHSLLYAVVVTDSQQEDPRMGNRNYLIMCILYSGQLEETIHRGRTGLTRLLRAFFTACNTVEKVTCNLDILDVLIRHHVFCMTVCPKREP
ncbi:MAG: hypothetical protein ACFFD4_38765 [Candidatus Odinarchaeota archaeon]